jgi:hypothetical protein
MDSTTLDVTRDSELGSEVSHHRHLFLQRNNVALDACVRANTTRDDDTRDGDARSSSSFVSTAGCFC